MMVEVSVTTPPSTDAAPLGKARRATPAKDDRRAPGAGHLRPRRGLAVQAGGGGAWPVDLTLPQFRVLGILAEGSSAASGLADRLAVRRPSITALIDGLVARDLVDRRQEDS